MHDLNNLLDASGNGVTITHATAINNQGWIVGHGSGPDGEASFLLTPVPEPSGLALAVFAMMAFAMMALNTYGMPRHDRRLASVVVGATLKPSPLVEWQRADDSSGQNCHSRNWLASTACG